MIVHRCMIATSQAEAFPAHSTMALECAVQSDLLASAGKFQNCPHHTLASMAFAGISFMPGKPSLSKMLALLCC